MRLSCWQSEGVIAMTYEDFCDRVRNFTDGIGQKAKFVHDEGRHWAKCGDVTIIGNSESQQVLVRWGSGHAAVATI